MYCIVRTQQNDTMAGSAESLEYLWTKVPGVDKVVGKEDALQQYMLLISQNIKKCTSEELPQN